MTSVTELHFFHSTFELLSMSGICTWKPATVNTDLSQGDSTLVGAQTNEWFVFLHVDLAYKQSDTANWPIISIPV